MSEQMTINNLFRTMPATTAPNAFVTRLVDGSPCHLAKSAVPTIVKLSVPVGSVLKVTSLESTLLTSRGTNARRCCLVWLSSYSQGTTLRSSVASIFNGVYDIYVNGSSDSEAAVYVKSNAASGNDTFDAISLTGANVKLEVVAAVPSDAVKVVEPDANSGGGNLLTFSALRADAERRAA